MANITLVTASGATVTPKDDALIYEVFSPGNGLIYGGAVSIKDSSTLHITAGHGIVCGRKFTIDDSDIPVVLSSSGTLQGRLYIHLDLADVGEPISLLVETGGTLTPEVHDSDVNINNGVYDINIATFTVDTVTIDNLVNIDNTIAPIDFGTADISGIGDGSIKGAISELNADIANKLDKNKINFVTIQQVQTESNLLSLGLIYKLSNTHWVRLRTNTINIIFEKTENGGATWTQYWSK